MNADGDIELIGWFHLVWGDGLPGSNVDTQILYFLIDDQGRWTRLLLDEALAQRFRGLLTLDRRRVVVRGSALALPLSAPGSVLFPVVEVRTVNFESVKEETLAAQGAAALVGVKPWATLLCRFSDSTDVTPQAVQWVQQLMGSSSPGMDHYWRELSYDNINLTGSVVVGWYNLPQPASFYAPDPQGNPNFQALLNDCTAAADADVFFPNFTGINLLFNNSIGCCAFGGGATLTRDGQTLNYSVTWMPPSGFGHQKVMAHEMGHGFGLPHSSGPYAATYDSNWDVMSGGGICPPEHPDFGCVGVHTIAFHKNRLGWIPSAQRYWALPTTFQTINLERLAQPSNSDLLMARIPINGSVVDYYTVEARRVVGYDALIPGEAVLITRVNTALSDRLSQVVDPDGNGFSNDAGAMWTPGETFTDSANGISVVVNSSSSTGFNVGIQAGPPGPLFLDNAENGTAGWFASPPWTQTTATFHSPTHSWTDSPSGDYDNNILADLWTPPLDVSAFNGLPLTLGFWHRYDFEPNADFGTVTVVNFDNLTATQVASFTGTDTNWHQTTVNLSAFAGSSKISIVFAVTSNGSVTHDGWYLDDIALHQGGVPVINPGGVVNAASFGPGAAVTPGSIVAVFGSNLASVTAIASSLPLPTSLGAAALQFNASIAVPEFFVSASQTNVQIPWELAGQPSGSLTDTVGGITSNSSTVGLAEFGPGLFATNQQGTDQGAILIANTPFLAAPNGAFPGSRPAVRGVDFLEIYWTGGGAVSPPVATGAAASANPLSQTTTTPTLTVGGVNTPVLFSGLAPNFVGLYVVTCQVPANAPTGEAVPVTLTLGGVKSNTVTIAVQ
ncbi:MAG TPA: hypothetical protein VNN18_12035 [Candidatus Xenobia bacterium]|nr:hypothetical protein [Candidatus Xenobia bacterium]